MVAIEQIDDYVYSMCALKKDLKVKDVRTAAKASKDKDYEPEIICNREKMPVDADEWWGKFAVLHLKEREQDLSLQFLVEDKPAEFDLI